MSYRALVACCLLLLSSAPRADTSTASNRLFDLSVSIPDELDQTDRCANAVVRVANRLGRKVRLSSAQLLVYWHSAGELISVNGAETGSPRPRLSLLDGSGVLVSDSILARLPIDVCSGRTGDNRVLAVLRYTTIGGNSGRISASSTVCIRGNRESCDIVDHSQYPSGARPLMHPGNRSCAEPMWPIEISSTQHLCADPSVLPRISATSVPTQSACTPGTRVVTGGFPSDRKLCVSQHHNVMLSWVPGDSVPVDVRSSADGAVDTIPVTGAPWSPWYLRVGSARPERVERFERITAEGAVAYSVTLAGSRGKLPKLAGGRWKAVRAPDFLARAFTSTAANKPVYCGVSQTTSLCSDDKNALGGFTAIVEAMHVSAGASRTSTPVYRYSDGTLTTQELINEGRVPGATLQLDRRLLGHTARQFAELDSERPFSVTTVVDRLERPWAVAVLPNGDLLVTEKPGRLRIVRDGILDPKPVTGLPQIHVWRQAGLLDVALDPDFASNRRIYLSYSAGNANTGYGTEVVRGELRGRRLINTKKIFVALPKTRGNPHFGSRLAFGPRGHLFITLGDRGKRFWAQDLRRHPGSVIRINADGSIPPDNPFVGIPGALPEIYSYGHRNPQGLAIDPVSGRIWVHEHGPKGGDELNLIEAGANYGWPLVSFGEEYDGEPIGEGYTRDDLADPSWFWVPSIAPSGLAWYRGGPIAAFRQRLLVGGLKGQVLTALQTRGSQVVDETRWLEHALGRIRDVTNGPGGSIYLVTDAVNGKLLRLDPR